MLLTKTAVRISVRVLRAKAPEPRALQGPLSTRVPSTKTSPTSETRTSALYVITTFLVLVPLSIVTGAPKFTKSVELVDTTLVETLT
jgi:hypothetical protein